MLAICMTLLDEDVDKDDFERLYNEYKDLMMHTAYKYLNCREDVEDAVAEAFLRIAQNFDKIDRKICKKTANQLVMVLRNLIIDKYRYFERNDIPLFYCNEDIEDRSFNEYAVADIKMCLNELRQQDKDILYWYYIYGYSIKTLSRLLRTKELTVQKRLYRAKSRLIKKLELKKK